MPLSPPTTRIGYTVFAIGLLPVSAMFDRFQGVVTEDPAAPDACRIQVTVDVASMRMDDADRRGQALGPEMFDAARYPTMHFSGSCAPQSVTGTLTLHGVSRAVTFAMRRDGSQVICDGTVLRRDFGIVGMRDMVGPRVHIRLSVRLPPELGAGSEGSATPHG
ncbi:MAG: YceI family protein [Rhodospirillales bacterium]